MQAAARSRNFTPAHAKVAAWIFVVVAGFILVVTRSVLHALELVLGPFAGAAAREWEPYYVKLGLGLLPFALVCLLAGVLLQFSIPASTKPVRAGRLVLWGIAIAGWFLFALRTYGEALE